MKNFFSILLLLLIFALPKAQTTRFIYEVYVNPDTVNLVSLEHEITFLDVNNGQSLFISKKALERDSLIESHKEEQILDKENAKKKEKKKNKSENDFQKRVEADKNQSYFPFYVVKNLNNSTSNYYERFFDKEIQYEEDRKLDWKLENQTSKIFGHEAKKATLNFGGRQWTAWYTDDIKIPDGPYKFYGLPGLIVKLEDSKGDYKFELIAQKEIAKPFRFTPKADAVKSTRKTFKNDKAALMLTMKKQMSEMQNSNQGARDHMGGPPGGMQGGGGPPSGGMPPQGERPEGEMRDDSNRSNSNVSIEKSAQNPIELKNI